MDKSSGCELDKVVLLCSTLLSQRITAASTGVIHEEMWDLAASKWSHQGIELFQLWVNLPSAKKKSAAAVHLIRKEEIPLLRPPISGGAAGGGGGGSQCVELRVIAGEVSFGEEQQQQQQEEKEVEAVSGPGSRVAGSEVAILHVSLARGDGQSSRLRFTIPEEMSSVFVYIRRGSLLVPSTGPAEGKEEEEEEEVTAFNAVAFTAPERARGLRGANEVSFTLRSGRDGFDGLVLIGEPLGERSLPPVHSRPFLR
jgi:redox-sensitive bicupin YhaK (pirin superfamily)